MLIWKEWTPRVTSRKAHIVVSHWRTVINRKCRKKTWSLVGAVKVPVSIRHMDERKIFFLKTPKYQHFHLLWHLLLYATIEPWPLESSDLEHLYLFLLGMYKNLDHLLICFLLSFDLGQSDLIFWYNNVIMAPQDWYGDIWCWVWFSFGHRKKRKFMQSFL